MVTALSDLSTYYNLYTPPTIEFVGAHADTSANTGVGPITITKPVGAVAGDLLVIIASTRNSYLTAPSAGWTAVCVLGIQGSGGAPVDPSASNDNFYVWYKKAGLSEPASYDMVVNDDGVDGQAFNCLAFRNASKVDRYDALGAKIGPSVSIGANEILLSVHAVAYGTQTVGSIYVPTGMFMVDRQHNTTADVGTAIAYEKFFAAASSGTRTWTSSWAGTDSVITCNMRVS